MALWKDRNIFSAEYIEFWNNLIARLNIPEEKSLLSGSELHDFLLDGHNLSENIIGLYPRTSPECQLLHLSVHVLLSTALFYKRKEIIPSVKLFSNLFSRNIPAAVWQLFRLTQSTNIISLILDSPKSRPRSTVQQLLYSLAEIVAPYERYRYPLAFASQTLDFLHLPTIFRLLKQLIANVHISARYWRRFSQYYSLMNDLLNLGYQESIYFIRESGLAVVADLFCQEASPIIPQIRQKINGYAMRYGALEDINSKALLTPMISVMARCISCFRFPRDQEGNPPTLVSPPDGSAPPQIPDLENHVITHPEFIARVVRESTVIQRIKPVRDILTHLCWNNQRLTHLVIEETLGSYSRYDADKLKPYLRTIGSLLSISDGIQVIEFGLMFETCIVCVLSCKTV